MSTKTVGRATLLGGYALLLWAAVSTARERQEYEIAGDEFVRPSNQAIVSVMVGLGLCLIGALRLSGDLQSIITKWIPPNPETIYYRPHFMALNHRGLAKKAA